MFIFLLLGALTTSCAYGNSNCSNSQFTCEDLQCVDLKLRCDGKKNCNDGSDELNCELFHCEEPHFFKCDNGRCISRSFVCDQENDCDDFSDEKNCSNFKLNIDSVCEEGHWRCLDKLCIPLDWVCNGSPECLDGSDENEGCLVHEECDTFRCKNRKCLPNEWVCDGLNDCDDNSDEQDCENHVPLDQCIMDNRKFLCKNNKTCIDFHFVCDGVPNCPDGSDEGKSCNTSCNSIKCSHDCVPLPTGPKCVCPPGYHAVDDKNCKEINECETYGICDQKCRNTPGSYECYCEDKYVLQADNKTCKVSYGSGIMVFSSQKEIRALTLDSKSYFTVATNLQRVVGVAYDGNYIYWTEVSLGQESIARSFQDGSEKELIVTSGLGLPEDLAVDWLTGNIYFTDTEMKHIGICTDDGAHCTVLINKDISKPRGITLNVEEGDMYWTDWGEPAKIGYSLMDGSSDRPFVTNNMHWPNGLALDQPNGRLYWTDAKIMTLESVKLDGTDRRIILKNIARHPYAIAVFENKLYWSDWNTHTIQACDKFDGKNHHTFVEENKDLIYGISIYHTALEGRTSNPCQKNFCSDICLLRGKSYVCACPENKILDKDGHVCKDIESTQMLVGGTGNKLINILHQRLGKHDVTLIPNIVNRVGSLTFDSYSNVLYVSDFETKTIVALDMHTGVNKHLDAYDLGRINAMDFDATSNNLYICDMDRAVVEVINMNKMERKILIHDTLGEIPESIVTVPNEGIMYVSFHNSELKRSHIDRFDMDGRGRVHFIENNLRGPVSLIYDQDLHRIFFADAARRTIESTSILGSDRHNFRTLSKSPISIATLKDDLFWINIRSKELFWSEKSSAASYDKKIELGIEGDIEHIHLASLLRNKPEPNACRLNNNGCSHICLLAGKSTICTCPMGWELSNEGRTCIQRVTCGNQEFLCPHTNVCILKSFRCNGHIDCTYGEDEIDCEPIKKCNESQFQCDDGECVDEKSACNGSYDCHDKSDENGCEGVHDEIGCPPEHFTCNNSQCIQGSFKCNGEQDCKDGSDEVDCEDSICSEDQFRCDSGACIPKAWECDREFDCADSSDEHCSWDICPSGYYRCENNRCIDNKLKCDGHDDCGDMSDEKRADCLYHFTSSNCTANEISCRSNNSICIPRAAKCNGTAECPGKEDETDCSNCPNEEFECKNKHHRTCIPESWVCDGTDDCGDSSDESKDLCTQKNKTLSIDTSLAEICTDGYRCQNGACINITLVCNGHQDCYDGSDEGGLCESSCEENKNPCNQICIKTPNGPSCECNTGYILMGNGKTCADVNECQLDYPLCSQLCRNREGSFSCNCYNGFFLKSNKMSCKSDGPHMSFYFVVYSFQIRELAPKSNAMTVIFQNPLIKISSLDATVEPKLIFFSSEETQAIYKLDLQTKVMHYIRNVGFPRKISVDWATQNIYYTHADAGSNSISVCSFEEKCAKLIDIDDHLQVSSLAVDSVNKVLFYVQRKWGIMLFPTYVIYRTNLDGSNRMEIVKTTSGNVEDITFDLNKKVLYFKEDASRTINAVSYIGGPVTTLFTNISAAEGLKYFENHLYYFETNGHVMSCKLYFIRICEPQFELHNYATGQFAIEQRSLQPKVENVCSEHKCPYLCVPGSTGYKCLCHDGNLHNLTDACAENADTNKFSVHSVGVSSTKKSTGLIISATLVSLLLIIIAAVFYSFMKKKSKTGLNISMKFYNPLYGKPVDDHKPILRPGEHEYANPIIITEDSSKLWIET